MNTSVFSNCGSADFFVETVATESNKHASLNIQKEPLPAPSQATTPTHALELAVRVGVSSCVLATFLRA